MLVMEDDHDEAIQPLNQCDVSCVTMAWRQSVTCSKESSAQQRVTRRGSDASGVVASYQANLAMSCASLATKSLNNLYHGGAVKATVDVEVAYTRPRTIEPCTHPWW
ncbi:hypothetical protein TSUD_32080 [Trifolium subterraneum]|uniref:Uncharacterized protein n=1 Tax=Trifolium subterraneum TaxID=3900 RepID=A0A2Z6PR85_TRISU|nr:hypothetical protein TSUD_32080 [Trifolium subterraneum]